MYNTKLTEETIKELLDFIYESHINTYAAGGETNQKYRLTPPRNMGHKEFLYDRGNWSYHDSYCGEVNFFGKEIIYLNQQPIWTMAYKSKLLVSDFDTITRTYDFLKEALRNNTPELPFRGPASFEKDGFIYSFVIQNGDCKDFLGMEEIYYDGKLIYTTRVMGGTLEG